jgi:hypothetical protein
VPVFRSAATCPEAINAVETTIRRLAIVPTARRPLVHAPSRRCGHLAA